MCCDFFKLAEQVKAFEDNRTELFHIDIMDGEFVPNFTLGTDFVRQIKKNSKKTIRKNNHPTSYCWQRS